MTHIDPTNFYLQVKALVEAIQATGMTLAQIAEAVYIPEHRLASYLYQDQNLDMGDSFRPRAEPPAVLIARLTILASKRKIKNPNNAIQAECAIAHGFFVNFPQGVEHVEKGETFRVFGTITEQLGDYMKHYAEAKEDDVIDDDELQKIEILMTQLMSLIYNTYESAKNQNADKS